MKSTITAAICLVFLAPLSTKGMSVRGIGVDLRCRCIETESRRMAKLIQSVELFPPSAHCKDTEIIATLKGTGQQICLDTTAPWVKKVIEKILANKKP
ncbi:interleukin-8 [Anguilla rostrata]|uniref:interleukin-8 n=1 Tax=Anguilla rostrata TaxID=7938 RepID=UPI0030D4AF59